MPIVHSAMPLFLNPISLLCLPQQTLLQPHTTEHSIVCSIAWTTCIHKYFWHRTYKQYKRKLGQFPLHESIPCIHTYTEHKNTSHESIDIFINRQCRTQSQRTFDYGRDPAHLHIFIRCFLTSLHNMLACQQCRNTFPLHIYRRCKTHCEIASAVLPKPMKHETQALHWLLMLHWAFFV